MKSGKILYKYILLFRRIEISFIKLNVIEKSISGEINFQRKTC